MVTGRFYAIGLEEPRRALWDYAGFISISILLALLIIEASFPNFIYTYPISLLNPYGWPFVVSIPVPLLGWRWIRITRRNYMTLYAIDFKSYGNPDGGGLEMTYKDLVKSVGGKGKEKRLDSPEIKTFPNEPLYWDPPLGSSSIRVSGTTSTLKIISHQKSAHDLLLAFSSPEEMNEAHSYLFKGKNSESRSDFTSKSILKGVVGVSKLTWMYYIIAFFFDLFILVLVYYFDYNWVLNCQSGYPASLISFGCAPIYPILTLGTLIAAMIRKTIHDRRMAQRLMDVATLLPTQITN
jgi:hypothetical protein